jgi:hypothetical protein
VLSVTVPMLYVVRKSDQRPLCDRWLLGFAAIYVVAAAIGWYGAFRVGFTRLAFRHALALTVPLGQMSLLLLSIGVFKLLKGRLPAEFTFRGYGQSNADTLMHGFVFVAVGIGGLAVCASFFQ